VDKSLVVARERGGEMRYRLLETIRQYGREKLEASGEAEDVRRRHALFFLRLAEEAEPAMLGPQQDAWMGRLEMEHDNLRAALGWLRQEGALERDLRLAGALGRFWWFRGYFTEGRAWLEELLELAEAPGRTVVRAKALHALGVLIHRSADYAAGD
jgi:non-specific serine/threonine protein kinase